MTFQEAMLEAHRRRGYDPELSKETMAKLCLKDPNNPAFTRQIPAGKEEAIITLFQQAQGKTMLELGSGLLAIIFDDAPRG